MIDSYVHVTLPGGLWRDGGRHQVARLRPLTGSDQAFLLTVLDQRTPVAASAALLARCVASLGAIRPVTPAVIQELAVGDREALLLHLRAQTLGDRLQCVLRCPEPGCGEKLDLDLLVGDLLLPPYATATPWHEATLEANGTAYGLRFRLPTGADQEAIATASADLGEAAQALLRRCVAEVTVDGQPVEGWPDPIAERLPAIMSELDPQAEITLNLTCPACGHAFAILFDTATFFFQELRHRSAYLFREVHTLALYYHWSEAELMNMPLRKRQTYLQLLDEAFGEATRR